MEILHVSAECFPAAKVGGLGDVVGALPKYQNNMGVTSKVVIPYYVNSFTRKSDLDRVYKAHIKMGDLHYDFEVLQARSNPDFPLYLIRIPGLLDRSEVYSYEDDVVRFLAFQIATLDWVLTLKKKPALVHCHDHHTGLIPFMMSNATKYAKLREIPTVLTIHNAQYQGQFGYEKLRYFPDFNLERMGLLDWNNSINPLATGIKCAWRVTTVSPSYLEELKKGASGLESLIRKEGAKFFGILNGIDTSIWNPEKDAYITQNYSDKTTES